MKRNKGVVSFIFTFGLVFLLISACSSNDSKEETKSNDTNEKEKVEVNKDLASEGEKIVKSSCVGCHGIDLKGDMGPNLHNLPYTKEYLIDFLIKGKGSMPPGTANGKEEAVAEYLLSLK